MSAGVDVVSLLPLTIPVSRLALDTASMWLVRIVWFTTGDKKSVSVKINHPH